MPIPNKESGESENEYIGRCMAAIGDEYPQDQALAICYNKFRENMNTESKVLNRIKLEVIDNVDKNIFKDQFIFVETTPVAFDNTTYAYVTGEFTFFIDGEHHKSIIENRMNRITPFVLKHLGEHEKFTYTRERERV